MGMGPRCRDEAKDGHGDGDDGGGGDCDEHDEHDDLDRYTEGEGV